MLVEMLRRRIDNLPSANNRAMEERREGAGGIEKSEKAMNSGNETQIKKKAG